MEKNINIKGQEYEIIDRFIGRISDFNHGEWEFSCRHYGNKLPTLCLTEENFILDDKNDTSLIIGAVGIAYVLKDSTNTKTDIIVRIPKQNIPLNKLSPKVLSELEELAKLEEEVKLGGY